MNERVVPKMINFCVVKLSNSPAITQHREVPVPRRQDVDERPCVPRLELDHLESQPDSPRINQRFPRQILAITRGVLAAITASRFANSIIFALKQR